MTDLPGISIAQSRKKHMRLGLPLLVVLHLSYITQLFRKLEPLLLAQSSLKGFLPAYSTPYSTPFTDTATDNGETAPTSGSAVMPIPLTTPIYAEIAQPILRPDRPALVVSSTSWTPDEDFAILLEAMEKYEQQACQLADNVRERLPKLLVIVTGKGPQRKKYMADIKKLQSDWKWVRCISLWLDADDYPILLGNCLPGPLNKI